LDGSEGALRALQTADAAVAVHLGARVDALGTVTDTPHAVDALVVVEADLPGAHALEQGEDGSQGADHGAEGALPEEHGGDGEQQQDLLEPPPFLHHRAQFGVDQGLEQAAFQRAHRAEFGEPGLVGVVRNHENQAHKDSVAEVAQGSRDWAFCAAQAADQLLEPAEGAEPAAHHTAEQGAEEEQDAQGVEGDCGPQAGYSRAGEGERCVAGSVLQDTDGAGEIGARAGPSVEDRSTEALPVAQDEGVGEYQGGNLHGEAVTKQPVADRSRVDANAAWTHRHVESPGSARCGANEQGR